MKPNETRRRALVLGGGGVAGIAWELGIILGLFESGVDVRDADLVIGTSAGSAVSAQITTVSDLESLFTIQLQQETKERMVEVDTNELTKRFAEAVAGAGTDLKTIRARLGALALTTPTITESERKEIIQARLPVQNWSEKHLQIVTVNALNGEEYIIDRTSGVPLVDAVAASCAIPGIWPPATIGKYRYIDGGMRSATNADLAAGYQRILILNPLGANANVFGTGPEIEIAHLKKEGSEVVIIEPDTASIAAIGQNPLDPATRGPAAIAGRTQAKTVLPIVTALWS